MAHGTLAHGDRRVVLHPKLLEFLQHLEILRLEVRLLAGRPTRVDLRLAVETAAKLVGHECDQGPPGAARLAGLLKPMVHKMEERFPESNSPHDPSTRLVAILADLYQKKLEKTLTPAQTKIEQ